MDVCVLQKRMMTGIKLTDDDFKEVNLRMGVKYCNIDEKLVRYILDDQEIVERLKLVIDKYDEKVNECNIVGISRKF